MHSWQPRAATFICRIHLADSAVRLIGAVEKLRNDLTENYNNPARQLEVNDLSDDQVAEIEAFCAEIREGLDNTTTWI